MCRLAEDPVQTQNRNVDTSMSIERFEVVCTHVQNSLRGQSASLFGPAEVDLLQTTVESNDLGNLGVRHFLFPGGEAPIEYLACTARAGLGAPRTSQGWPAPVNSLVKKRVLRVCTRALSDCCCRFRGRATNTWSSTPSKIPIDLQILEDVVCWK